MKKINYQLPYSPVRKIHIKKGKITVHSLKLALIFNSTTTVSIYSIDPLKVLKSFNSGTFDFFSQIALAGIIVEGFTRIIVEGILGPNF